MARPRVLVLRAPGTNCDHETLFACEQAGAIAERRHVTEIRESPGTLRRFQMLIVPGGFSYGDDLGAGTVLALQLRLFLGDALRRFRDEEKLILGVCNGFQALLRAGLLIPPDEDGPLATLTRNHSGRFVDRWVRVRATAGHCPLLEGCEEMDLPVAHGEGLFRGRQEWIVRGLDQAGQVVLRYAAGDRGGEGAGAGVQPDRGYNPNGSQLDIAGVCDATGRVVGMMPHPERHVLPTQHPRWTRRGLAGEGDGLRLFRNAVRFFA